MGQLRKARKSEEVEWGRGGHGELQKTVDLQVMIPHRCSGHRTGAPRMDKAGSTDLEALLV